MAADLSRLRSWFLRSGWVVIFFAVCGTIYLHATLQKDHTYQDLSLQLKALNQQKIAASEDQKELLLQIQSQSDPAWVEMCLKRNLGLVPEGQVKVYFHEE